MEALADVRLDAPRLRAVATSVYSVELSPRLLDHAKSVIERGCLLAKDCDDCEAIRKAIVLAAPVSPD